MKQVSTNHPSLRGVQCYDCGDDTARHGWLDEIDSAFFCQSCYNERHPRLSDRKKTIGDRRWPEYRQRIRNRQRQLVLGSLILLTVASLTDNFWYVCGAGSLVIWSTTSYLRGGQ